MFYKNQEYTTLFSKIILFLGLVSKNLWQIYLYVAAVTSVWTNVPMDRQQENLTNTNYVWSNNLDVTARSAHMRTDPGQGTTHY